MKRQPRQGEQPGAAMCKREPMTSPKFRLFIMALVGGSMLISAIIAGLGG